MGDIKQTGKTKDNHACNIDQALALMHKWSFHHIINSTLILTFTIERVEPQGCVELLSSSGLNPLITTKPQGEHPHTLPLTYFQIMRVYNQQSQRKEHERQKC